MYSFYTLYKGHVKINSAPFINNIMISGDISHFQTKNVVPFCENEVESEIHFLLDCPVYRNIRTELINLIERENPFFRYLQKEAKFSYLLANANQKEVAEYIHNSFELRNFLTMSPKRVE